MPIEFVGGSVTLDPNGTGEIKLEYQRDAEIIQMIFNSTGRVALTNLELVGKDRYITGEIELDQLKENGGNVYTLPESLPYDKGRRIQIGLRDLSGASNTVYIGFVMRY